LCSTNYFTTGSSAATQAFMPPPRLRRWCSRSCAGPSWPSRRGDPTCTAPRSAPPCPWAARQAGEQLAHRDIDSAFDIAVFGPVLPPCARRGQRACWFRPGPGVQVSRLDGAKPSGRPERKHPAACKRSSSTWGLYRQPGQPGLPGFNRQFGFLPGAQTAAQVAHIGVAQHAQRRQRQPPR
jgi:hypothetical protein